MNNIRAGVYRHYKGNHYEIVGFAKHSETDEDVVVYKDLAGDHYTWVRPLSMWEELIEVGGKTVKRFEYIDESSTIFNAQTSKAKNDPASDIHSDLTQSSMAFDIRPIEAETRDMVTEFLTDYWSGTFIIIHDEIVDITTIDGFVHAEHGSLSGVATYIVRGEAMHIVSLNSVDEKRGVGTALVNAVIDRARELGCHRVQLMTSNDNLNGIGFYQKRGFDLVGVDLFALDRERERKPTIPLIGQNGIPLRHEIEFSLELTT